MPHIEPDILLSIIAPAHNEEGNVAPLVREIEQAMQALDAKGEAWEFILVDDGSTDGTLGAATALLPDHPRLRIVKMRHTPAGRGHGQSAATHAGIRASRGRFIATLDADLQNDPADLPRMMATLRDTQADLVQGDRSGKRRDTLVRRASSVISRWFRVLLLNDPTVDTGCCIRVMTRQLALSLPLEFRGQHRFVPFTTRSMGLKVVEHPVNHRPRVSGQAKYGIWNRALPGLIDCFAVRWMRRRRRPVAFDAITMPETVRAEGLVSRQPSAIGHQQTTDNRQPITDDLRPGAPRAALRTMPSAPADAP